MPELKTDESPALGMQTIEPPLSSEKQVVIKRITGRSREAFMTWVKQSEHRKRLDIPSEAMQYFLPPRLLELVSDPNQLQAMPTLFRPHELDMDFLDGGSKVMDISLQVEDGRPETLYVAGYDDREELRRRGIGKSFYTRLEEIAKELGFRFITGINDKENIPFFRDVLKRSLLSDVKSGLQDEFIDVTIRDPAHPPEYVDPDLFTIDFLYPEDKPNYLLPHTY